MALWPLTAHGIGGIGLGAAWTLPPTLHAIGIMSAAFVCLRMLAMAFRRWRGPRKVPPSIAACGGAAAPAQRWTAPLAAQSAKSHAQFGLRRLPQ